MIRWPWQAWRRRERPAIVPTIEANGARIPAIGLGTSGLLGERPGSWCCSEVEGATGGSDEDEVRDDRGSTDGRCPGVLDVSNEGEITGDRPTGITPKPFAGSDVAAMSCAARLDGGDYHPETVPFWQLPSYIELADRAGLVAAGYRLQYQQLLARPFLLAAMVMLAASVSLRFFRFGGVQKMVLSGISAGFLLFVLSKITEDMSKSELVSPVMAAWIPVLVGSLTGFVALLYQEDG